jgi:hypothetical protein
VILQGDYERPVLACLICALSASRGHADERAIHLLLNTLVGSDVELMIVYGAAIAHYGFGTPVRALAISRYLEMPRKTVRRHMGRLVALGLFERAEDQTFVPSKELRQVEIERALRLLRQGTAGLL